MTGVAPESKNNPRFHRDALTGTAVYVSPIFIIKNAVDIYFLSQPCFHLMVNERYMLTQSTE